jgi:hypothetical protein
MGASVTVSLGKMSLWAVDDGYLALIISVILCIYTSRTSLYILV